MKKASKKKIRKQNHSGLWLSWWEWKIKWLFFWLELNDKWKRFWYCRRNYHKPITGSTEVSNSKGLHLKTAFIRCIYCNTIFFTNKRNKDHYQRIRQRERPDFRPFINGLNLKESIMMPKKQRAKLMAGRLKTKEFKVR